jgi:hypothetical protein
MLQPRAVKNKFYLTFASEDFSIEIIIYKKKISVNYQKKKKKWGKIYPTSQRYLLRSKGPMY